MQRCRPQWPRFLLRTTTLALAGYCSAVCSAQVALVDVTVSKGLGAIDSVPGDGHAPGAVFTDLDNDGYPDLYMMGGRNWVQGVPLRNRLYLNVPATGGGRRFQEQASALGAGDRGEHIGAIAADYDNDGDRDLYVLNWQESDDPTSTVAADRNRLYRNDLVETGSLGFTDVTLATDPTPGVSDAQYGVGWATHNGQPVNQSLTAAWADPDRDGDLDLYVGTHHGWLGGWNGSGDPGQRDTFYRNNGDGTFTDATMELGLTGFETESGAHEVPGTQSYSSSNAVIFADFNNDRWPDLLVTNKIGGPIDRDMLYINRGADADGTWLGYDQATYDLPTTFGHRTGAAMGVAVGDIDNDGDIDFYLTDWSNPFQLPADGTPLAPDGSNDLWINQLSETGELDFVHSDELKAAYSWGVQFVDFDNNGFLDVHAATEGGVRDALYLNSAEGFGAEVGAEAGFVETYSGRGDVSADYNRDGLVDLLVINPWGRGRSVLYENQSTQAPDDPQHAFLIATLEGDPSLPGRQKSSRDAIGARVVMTTDLDGDGTIEDHEQQIREVVSGSSNSASTSSLDQSFGAGQGASANVSVLWPSGRETRLTTPTNAWLAIREIVGDANADAVVDGQDLLAWQEHFGLLDTASQGEGDADLDGRVLGADLLWWQRGHGDAALASSAAAVRAPEPSGWVLGALALALASMGARWRRKATAGVRATTPSG